MVAAEVIALVALLFGGAAGLKAVWAWSRRASEARSREELKLDQMQQDLRAALESRDYRRLDDFAVTWADYASARVMEHVKQRRDELFVDSNM